MSKQYTVQSPEVALNTKKKVKQKTSFVDLLHKTLIVLMVLGLVVALIFPLIQLILVSLQDRSGSFVGLENFINYFTTSSLIQPLFNTLFVASATGIISVTLGFFYAYALTRTNMPWKPFFRYVAFVPLFAPTMMYGIGLVHLFGNNGVVTTGFFGMFQGIDINLYGPVGIIISLIFYTFPQTFLLLTISLSNTDYRLYEAADSLGSGVVKKFFSVTLPSVKYGLFSAFIIGFILSFTDFGAPIVVGGDFKVMAVDIYQQVVGQFNMSMGATVGVILIIPAVIAFIADQLVQRKESSSITAKSVSYKIKENPVRDRVYFTYCLLIMGAIFLLMVAVLVPTFVKYWPYDFSFTTAHFTFENVIGGFKPYYTSLLMAVITATAGTLIVFIGAYLIEKTRFMRTTRKVGYLFSIMPLALPGLAIGLAYIFFFNQAEFAIPFTNIAITNPLQGLYGTIWILVLANLIHFYAVNFFTATTALKKLDKEFEPVSESMNVPFYKTFVRVTVPMSLPAILEMMVYFFVNSMTTISAVIFLYSPDTRPASVAIVDMVGAGNMSAAAAMAVIILLTNIVVRVAYEFITKKVRKRASAWQQ
ncbi:putative 2-aminoethylphosphonate ABC transporter permease subunit [Bacillus piscicola]|uniref:putative 2-aminoethylphosphonate ABC transporter permease subunit n=1 Tax=Bacillus piscicola TaxID=1632684 RepID=UPI001F09BE47|nr:putative 2-aminoethylphosphonate ABC transporter permease subunit [Bacillus piscicola]